MPEKQSDVSCSVFYVAAFAVAYIVTAALGYKASFLVNMAWNVFADMGILFFGEDLRKLVMEDLFGKEFRPRAF